MGPRRQGHRQGRGQQQCQRQGPEQRLADVAALFFGREGHLHLLALLELEFHDSEAQPPPVPVLGGARRRDGLHGGGPRVVWRGHEDERGGSVRRAVARLGARRGEIGGEDRGAVPLRPRPRGQPPLALRLPVVGPLGGRAGPARERQVALRARARAQPQGRPPAAGLGALRGGEGLRRAGARPLRAGVEGGPEAPSRVAGVGPAGGEERGRGEGEGAFQGERRCCWVCFFFFSFRVSGEVEKFSF